MVYKKTGKQSSGSENALVTLKIRFSLQLCIYSIFQIPADPILRRTAFFSY